MKLRVVTSLAILLIIGCNCSVVDDAAPKWGHLKGRIVLEGELPKSAPLFYKPQFAGKDGILTVPNEDVIVDRKTKGIWNVVVYLRKKPSLIHPDLLHSKEKIVKFQAIGGRFDPHILQVRTDQAVDICSPDPFDHYVHLLPIKNEERGYRLQPESGGDHFFHVLPLAEREPVRVGCEIHCGANLAWWVVLDHPYSAVTGKDGSFEIRNLPVGEHDFTVWQEQAKEICPIETERVFKVSIAAGKTTTLDVKVPVSKFYRVTIHDSP